MKHKPIPKRIREIVYQKYNGHCAYCGSPIEYKDMQVDHVKSLYHNSLDNNLQDNPELTQDDSIDNLIPSCRQCNYYKGEADIEGFRNKIHNWLEKTCTDSFTVRLALKYGILEYKPWNGKFHFEQCQDQN